MKLRVDIVGAALEALHGEATMLERTQQSEREGRLATARRTSCHQQLGDGCRCHKEGIGMEILELPLIEEVIRLTEGAQRKGLM